MKLHEQIRARRIALKISQSKLSELTGLRKATISDFETGKKSMTSKNLEKVFEVLKLEVKEKAGY